MTSVPTNPSSASNKATNVDWEDGFHEGFHEGQTVGYEQAVQELISLTQILRKLSVHMLSEIEKISQRLKPELIELAMLTCEKYLYKKLDNIEEFSLLISAALQHHQTMYALTPTHIYLHPDDYQKLLYWMSTHDLPMIKNIEFIADPSCKKSSYKMKTSIGNIKQEIEEELDHLLSVLNS